MMQTDKDAPPSRAARTRWPLIIVGLLAAHVSAMMLAVQIASRDAGHAVLPDYYDKAVHWDDHQADARESARLGWSVSVTPSVLVDEHGDRTLRILMHDSAGEPLEGATLSLRVWHHAIGDASAVVVAPGSEPALYVAAAPMARSGTWQCELAAERGPARFIESYELNVTSPLEAGAAGQ